MDCWETQRHTLAYTDGAFRRYWHFWKVSLQSDGREQNDRKWQELMKSIDLVVMPGREAAWKLQLKPCFRSSAFPTRPQTLWWHNPLTRYLIGRKTRKGWELFQLKWSDKCGTGPTRTARRHKPILNADVCLQHLPLKAWSMSLSLPSLLPHLGVCVCNRW